MTAKTKKKNASGEKAVYFVLRTRYESVAKQKEREEKIQQVIGALSKHYGRKDVSRSEAINFLIDNCKL